MAQYDFSTINTSTTTGGDLATLLQNWRDAVLSSHSGTTRPTYIKAGQIWVNTATASAWVVNLYDGTVDIPLGYVNTTDDTAGFLSRVLVTTKTASATIVLTERDMMVGVSCSTAALTMTLPAATTAKNGFKIAFQKRDNTAYSVTINRSSTDLINGVTSWVLAGQYDTVELVCDGVSAWYAVGGVSDNGVTTAKIADGAVTTNKIAANSVTAAKLDSSISTSFVPTGALMPYAGTAAPSGWILCYGQAVSRTTYAALFAVLGGNFGVGDGSTTFNLPDLRGRVVAGMDSMGGVAANRLTGTVSFGTGGYFGASGGEEAHVITIAEMPAHTHTLAWQKQTPSGGSGDNASYLSGTGYTSTTSSAGSGVTHNNVQPTIVLNYIIKT